VKSKPATKYARTPKNIAEALGVTPTRAALKDIAEYRTWDDFPKRTRHGYDKDELYAFVERNKQKIQSRKNTARLLQPEEKTTAADLKLIGGGGAAPKSAPLAVGHPGAAENSVLGIADTQAALANMLAAHYKNRIRIFITPQLIHEWRTGNIAVKQCPLPPAKIEGSSRFDGREWAAWFDRYLLPHYAIGSGPAAAELDFDYARLEQQRHKNELERIEHERFERELARGKFIARELAARTLAGTIKKFHNLVKLQDERNLPLSRKEKLRELGVPEETLGKFHAWDLAQAQALTDARETQCAELGQTELEI
jgi:hypothetical protein